MTDDNLTDEPANREALEEERRLRDEGRLEDAEAEYQERE